MHTDFLYHFIRLDFLYYWRQPSDPYRFLVLLKRPSDPYRFLVLLKTTVRCIQFSWITQDNHQVHIHTDFLYYFNQPSDDYRFLYCRLQTKYRGLTFSSMTQLNSVHVERHVLIYSRCQSSSFRRHMSCTNSPQLL